MRQKHYWEMRIRELGGSDYHTLRKQVADIGNQNIHHILLNIEHIYDIIY